jgi:CBS domain-containing protein
MSTSVTYVRPDQTSEECMVLMTEHRLRHLPVIDKGKLVGLISIGDLLKEHYLRAEVHYRPTRALHQR